MASKNTVPVLVRCIDCRKDTPITTEFPAWDGKPVFSKCEHCKHYRNRRWPQPCEYYETK